MARPSPAPRQLGSARALGGGRTCPTQPSLRRPPWGQGWVGVGMSASTVPLAWQRPAGPPLKAGSRREGEPSAEALGLQGVLSLFCFLLCVYNGCASDDGKGKEPPRKRGSRLAVLVTAVCVRANSRAPLGSAPGSTPPRGPQGACQPQPPVGALPCQLRKPPSCGERQFPSWGSLEILSTRHEAPSTHSRRPHTPCLPDLTLGTSKLD